MKRLDEVIVRRRVGWGSGWEYEYGYVKFLYESGRYVQVRVFKNKEAKTVEAGRVFPFYGPIQAHAGGE